MLSSKQRAHLTSLAHHRKPVVLVGQNGLSDGVIQEAERALNDHELIKVKMRGADDLEEDAGELAKRTGAELIAVRGTIVILYKRHPEKPRIELPKS